MPAVIKRSTSKGKPRYQAQVRLDGYPPRFKTFDSARKAKAWAQALEDEMKSGRHEAVLNSRQYTACQMIDRYIDKVLLNKGARQRTTRQQHKQLVWWRGRLVGVMLCNLSSFLITECAEELAGTAYARRRPATVNRYLAVLGHVLKTAHSQWGWLSENPMLKVQRCKEPRGRTRYLTQPEMQRLLAACGRKQRGRLLLIVLLALCTGARKQEILRLRWRDVDLGRGVAVAYDTKNGDNRQLYLHPQLVVRLKALRQRCHTKRHELVFCSRQGRPLNIEYAWRKALQAAGIEGFRFHDLRHTAASYLAMNGAQATDIAEALGHKSYDMVKRYSHLSTTHVAGVVRSMNEAHINSAIGTHMEAE